MDKNTADEILNPNVKIMNFDEGFEIYKKYFNAAVECQTTLFIEDYPPLKVNGFTVTRKDSDKPIGEEDLKIIFTALLSGDESMFDVEW